MPEERSSQMSKCAFPPWLLNNRHTSFTLIKIKFSLPLLLLHFLYASTFINSFILLLLYSFIHLFFFESANSPSSPSTLVRLPLPLASPPCRHRASLMVSLRRLAQARSSPARRVSFVSPCPSACAARPQNVARVE